MAIVADMQHKVKQAQMQATPRARATVQELETRLLAANRELAAARDRESQAAKLLAELQKASAEAEAAR